METLPISEPLPSRIGLGRIFVAFLRLGATAFGGGTAGWLHREFVRRRGWVGEDDFLALLGLSQVLPGSNGVNLTVLIGHQLRGFLGAAAAVGGLLAAPFVIVAAIASAYGGIGEHPVVQAMLDGVAAVVIGLTVATGVSGLARGGAGPFAWSVAGVTVLAIGILRWPLLPVVAVMAPASIALAVVMPRWR